MSTSPEKGRAEAVRAGELIKELDRQPDVLYTSLLRRGDQHRQPRAGQGRPALDPGASRLAAQRAPLRRAAGPEQGRDQGEVRRRAVHGLAAQLRHPAAADRARAASTARTAIRATPTSPAGRRCTECLEDVVERFVPYYTATIVPDLQAGKTVLIAAHGNSLRALVKYLDGMSDDDVVGLEHPDRHPASLRPGQRPQADGHRRHVPGPRGGRGGCGGGGRPGRQVSADPATPYVANTG